MAYEDLTIEERQALQQSLLAPPPAMFAQAQPFEVDPLTRAQAAAGLLGPQGRFFEQMARQQEEAKLDATAAEMARELMGVSPFEMGKKAQELAARDPRAFASPTVQQALQLGSLARQEQKVAEQEAQQAKGLEMAQTIFDLPRQGFTQALKERAKADPDAFNTPEVQQAVSLREQEIREQQARRSERRGLKKDRAEAELRSTIAQATPEQLDAIEAQAPQFLPDIEKRRTALEEISTVEAQLPPELRTPENLARPSKAKSALNKFNMSLPPRLRKVEDYSLKQAVVEEADQYVQLLDRMESLEKAGEEVDLEDPQFRDLDSLRSSIAVTLGIDPDKGIPDSEIRRYAALKPKFSTKTVDSYNPRSRPAASPEVDPVREDLRQSVIQSLTPR
jgi:hypothetical protein